MSTDNWKLIETRSKAALPEAIVEYIAQCRGDEHSESYLISILHKVQNHFGYLGAEQMDAVAMGPLMVQASGNQTATGKAIDEGKGQCKLQAWVHLLEAGIDQSIRSCCEWVGEAKPDEVSTDINDDFELLGRSTEDLSVLEKARTRGDIDHETFLDGLKIRRVLRENADIKEIMRRCDEEAPLGLIGRENEQDEAPAE